MPTVAGHSCPRTVTGAAVARRVDATTVASADAAASWAVVWDATSSASWRSARAAGAEPFSDHHSGRGHDDIRGSDDDAVCTFTANRLECTETEHGLTVTRSTQYLTSAGAVQGAFDSLTTNSVNVKTSVSGTLTRHDIATATIQHASDRTVTGLAAGSTQRTVNGYPTAGTVIRNMSATVTVAGGSPTATVRREVITFDGSPTARIVITHDGTTKTCTLPLPSGRPTCG